MEPGLSPDLQQSIWTEETDHITSSHQNWIDQILYTHLFFPLEGTVFLYITNIIGLKINEEIHSEGRNKENRINEVMVNSVPEVLAYC